MASSSASASALHAHRSSNSRRDARLQLNGVHDDDDDGSALGAAVDDKRKKEKPLVEVTVRSFFITFVLSVESKDEKKKPLPPPLRSMHVCV